MVSINVSVQSDGRHSLSTREGTTGPNVSLNTLQLIEIEEKQVTDLLTRKSDVFSQDDDDIRYVPELKLDIQMVDKVPVKTSYRSIPHALYDAVKTTYRIS